MEFAWFNANWIQLLAPANEALSNPCLTGPITEYPWVEGIALMTVFIIFFTELMAMRFAVFAPSHSDNDSESGLDSTRRPPSPSTTGNSSGKDLLRHRQGHVDPKAKAGSPSTIEEPRSSLSGYTPGEDHLSHSRDHVDPDSEEDKGKQAEDYTAQMTAIFILEFGVVFHSIFVGLTLAVAGAEFKTLYVVLVFHQTFEGLGLGSRLAATPWPKSKPWTAYILALIFGLSTPIALGVGLGIRESYAPNSQKALIVNGVLDSISAGILIYTGLVELMAHEFMFSKVMRNARLRVVLSAFGLMCLGAGMLSHGHFSLFDFTFSNFFLN